MLSNLCYCTLTCNGHHLSNPYTKPNQNANLTQMLSLMLTCIIHGQSSMSHDVRHNYKSHLSCLNEGDNLFMKLLAECLDERLNSIFDWTFMLTLTGLTYLQPDKQQGYKNYSPLMSTSLNHSRITYCPIM